MNIQPINAVETPINPAFVVLKCGTCLKTWDRQRQKGRQPGNCPECQEKIDAQKTAGSKQDASGNSEKIQELECTSETCKLPDKRWTRPSTRGNRPILCPDCKAEKETLDAATVDDGPRTQSLRCNDEDCPSPEWTRDWKPGREPKYCTECQDKHDEVRVSKSRKTHEEVGELTPETFDAKVYVADTVDAIPRIMEALRKTYGHTTFYIADGDGMTIMIKRAHSYPIASDTLDRLQAVADAAVTGTVLTQAPEPTYSASVSRKAS